MSRTRRGTERASAADPATGEADRTRMFAAVADELARQLERSCQPGLTLVATPIGNLGDMSLRAIATLATADLILCEDTRTSRTLFSRFGIDRPLRALHDHNEAGEIARVLAELEEGRAIALVSDAGMPLVSDPGYKLVRAVVEAGHAVQVVPGPSATLAALVVSGLPTDAFHVAGFLPPRRSARRARLAELGSIPSALVLLETAPRAAETLSDIGEVLAGRDVAMVREITKRFEEVRRGNAAAMAASIAADPVRGEIVLVVAPPVAEAEADDATIEAALAVEPPGTSLRDAARAVAERLGVPRSRVYGIGLRQREQNE